MGADMRRCRVEWGTFLLAVSALGWAEGGAAQTRLDVTIGVTETGEATSQWLAMIRKRLDDARFDSVAPMRKALTDAERAWAALIRSRAASWEREVAPLAALFEPVRPPADVLIVMGNRGAEDAFTHDPVTIGFDLAALESVYGGADLPESADRTDRMFRHEFVHLMQKAWLPSHPYGPDSPLGAALLDIWLEGLGNYYSMSDGWRSTGGARSAAAKAALAELEPRGPSSRRRGWRPRSANTDILIRAWPSHQDGPPGNSGRRPRVRLTTSGGPDPSDIESGTTVGPAPRASVAD